MEFYVKMTDKELEDFKNSKNNPNLVNIKELNITQLLDLKLKKVDINVTVNPMTGLEKQEAFMRMNVKALRLF